MSSRCRWDWPLRRWEDSVISPFLGGMMGSHWLLSCPSFQFRHLLWYLSFPVSSTGFEILTWGTHFWVHLRMERFNWEDSSAILQGGVLDGIQGEGGLQPSSSIPVSWMQRHGDQLHHYALPPQWELFSPPHHLPFHGVTYWTEP